MKYIVFLASLALVACTLQSKSPRRAEKQRSPTAYADDYLESRITDTTPEDLSFDELKKILRENSFSSIEALLNYLKSNKPEYMSRYAVGFNSRSLHGSSKENPRVLVYGKRGNFIISFNGHKDQVAYEMLEVVEFNHKKNIFEYREIEFNEFGQLNKNYKISDVDGPKSKDFPQGKCLQCHNNRRPIWEFYDVWPGFFGGDDDLPIALDTKRLNSTILGPKVPQSVVQEWMKFKNETMRRGRYASLLPLSKSTINPKELRPNTDLNVALAQRNYLRIGQILKNTVKGNFKYALLYSATCQPHFSRVLQSNLTVNSDKEEAKKFVNPKLAEFTQAYLVKANPLIRNHQVFKYSELIKDLGLTTAQVQEYRGVYDNEDPQDFAHTDPVKYVNAVLKTKHAFEYGNTEVASFQAPFLALVDHYLPKAQIETWPMTIYANVQRYDSGIPYDSAFRDTILDFLFSKQEATTYKAIEDGRQFSEFCSAVQAKLPAELL